MAIYKKRIIFSISLLFTVLLLVGLLIIRSQRNPYGNQLEVSNLDVYTSNKPTNEDRVNFIQSSLYKTVGLNVDYELENNSLQDVLVREGSFNQIYNETTNIHTVSFIVDIESLQQSYAVSYQWHSDKEFSNNIDEYGTQITCLPIEKLIYPPFECVDERILEVGVDNYDPVGRLLPYSVKYKYDIKHYRVGNDKVTLEVENPYIPVRGTNPETVLEDYTREVKAWLKLNNLNPDNYKIVFIVPNAE